MYVKLACLLIVALLAAPRPGAAQEPKGPRALQGQWKLVSVETGGNANVLSTGQPRWLVKGDKVFYGGDELAVLVADAGANPKTIDLKFRTTKKTYEGIYTIDKDTLKICLNGQTDGVKDRPATFATRDQANRRLLVFQRDRADSDPNAGLSGFVGMMLQFDMNKNQVVVTQPLEGSPAFRAGLKKDDIIVRVAATAATDLRTTIEAVRQARPGTELTLRINRAGKEQDVTVRVGVIPFHYLAVLE